MTLDPNVPFALHDLFFNELVGSITLGIFVALIIFLFKSIQFKIAYAPLVMLLIVFMSVLYIGTMVDWLWVGIGMMVSGLAYYKISKAINRG